MFTATRARVSQCGACGAQVTTSFLHSRLVIQPATGSDGGERGFGRPVKARQPGLPGGLSRPSPRLLPFRPNTNASERAKPFCS